MRLVRGIDTPEGVADYESAADHALTLKKFQELNQALQHEYHRTAQEHHRNVSSNTEQRSVFRSTYDNTTNLSGSAPANAPPSGIWPEVRPEDIKNALPQKLLNKQRAIEENKRAEREAAGIDTSIESGEQQIIKANEARQKRVYRWKYAGPSLNQMTGMEFDDYLHKLGDKERNLLDDRIKKEIKRERLVKAREEGTMTQELQDRAVTDEEVKNYRRHLRQDPEKFGPIIADLLDMPEGIQNFESGVRPWTYGRTTLATGAWRKTGPPRTHPSAGLSYLQDNRLADNDPMYGPQRLPKAVLARVVKKRHAALGINATRVQADVGVAGFIASEVDNNKSATDHYNRTGDLHPAGQKFAVEVVPSHVKPDGALDLQFKKTPVDLYRVQNDRIHFERVISDQEAAEAVEAGMNRTPSAPMLSNVDAYQPRPSRRLRREQVESTPDIAEELSRYAPRPGSGI